MLQLDGLWRTAWPRCSAGHGAECRAQRGSAGAAGSTAAFPATVPAAHLVLKCNGKALTAVFREEGRASCTCGSVWCSGAVPPALSFLPALLLSPSHCHCGSACRQPREGAKHVPLYVAEAALGKRTKKRLALRWPQQGPSPPTPLCWAWSSYCSLGAVVSHEGTSQRTALCVVLAVRVLKTVRIHTTVVKSQGKFGTYKYKPQRQTTLLCAEVFLLITSETCL